MTHHCAHCEDTTSGSDYYHPSAPLSLFFCGVCGFATDTTYNLNVPFSQEIFRILSSVEQSKLIARAPYLNSFHSK